MSHSLNLPQSRLPMDPLRVSSTLTPCQQLCTAASPVSFPWTICYFQTLFPTHYHLLLPLLTMLSLFASSALLSLLTMYRSKGLAAGLQLKGFHTSVCWVPTQTWAARLAHHSESDVTAALFCISKLPIILFEIRTMPTQSHFIKALSIYYSSIFIQQSTQQMFYFNSYRGQHIREYLNAYHNRIRMKHLGLRRKPVCCAKSKRNMKG